MYSDIDEIFNENYYRSVYNISAHGNSDGREFVVPPGYNFIQLQDFGFELRKSKRDKGLLNAEIHFVKINYKGESNSTIGFEMLEGLQVGQNTTWRIGFQKNMSNNIQISINYNGRKSENNKAVHNGSMQMRAFF